MTTEEAIRQIELELEKIGYHKELELNFADLIQYRNKKLNPQEEINKIVNLLIKHPTNASIKCDVIREYGRLVLMRDNPNWRDELKEEYKHNFKKFIVLGIIPVGLFMWGVSVIMDEIFLLLRGEFSSIPNVYHFQFLVMNIIIPVYIYNPKYFINRSCNDIYSEIVRRYNTGGNILFFSSLILLLFTDFYNSLLANPIQSEQNLTWSDIRCFVIPFCIGFVFFYNSFLKK